MMTIPGIPDPMPAALMSFGMDFTDPFGLNAAMRDAAERLAEAGVAYQRRQQAEMAKAMTIVYPIADWSVADMVAGAAGPVNRCTCGFGREVARLMRQSWPR